MTTYQAVPTLRRTPAAIVLVRILLAVQVALGVAAAAMTGFLLLLAFAFLADDSSSGIGLAVIAVVLAFVITANIMLLRGLFLIRRGRDRAVATVSIVEALLGAAIVVLLSATGLSWGVGAWASAPVIDLVCCAAVPALLHSPAARRWTDPRSL